jgi:excisionase family DNA binding protein
MTQSNQYVTGDKPYSFFHDSEIEDWFKKNHTLSYLKFKSKIEPLEERIYRCETLNAEMESRINELIEDSYFISGKINDRKTNHDNSIDITFSGLEREIFLITKLINLLFRFGLSLFPIISIYALIHNLIDKVTGTYFVSFAIAAFFGFSLSHFSSKIVQLCSSFYWSELRAGIINQGLFLLFALIMVLEGFIGVYGMGYLMEQNQLSFGRTVIEQLFLFLPPTLFSLINVSYSFAEEMKQHEKLKMIDFTSKRDATHELIKDLRGRIEKNYEDLCFYRSEYNEALSGHKGFLDYLDAEKDSVKSLYGSTRKTDENEDLIIRVHFDRDSTNSYYELNSHGVTKTFESNNETLKQVSQIINKLIPGQQQTNEELHSKLTVYESADILNVSIPYVINLVESGKIPSQGNGSSYHIDLSDLLAYKQESDAESHYALAELAREAQELDMGY